MISSNSNEIISRLVLNVQINSVVIGKERGEMSDS